MKSQRDTSLRIRLAGLAIISLFIALGAAAYFSAQQVDRDSELVVKDAVPGTIAAQKMRLAMSRGIGWALVAASAQTTQSRDHSLKIVHDADTAFTNEVTQYKATIVINPAADQALLEQVTSRYAKYYQQRMAYEALIVAGDRDQTAFLDQDLVPAYVLALDSAEKLLDYNNANSITYANRIRNSVHRLHLTVAVVMVLALFCAAVLVVNFAIRRREIMKLGESEEKFSKAFRANPVGIAITEVETGRYVEVNDSFCRLLEYSQPEMVGRTSVETGVWGGTEERNRMIQPLLTGGHLTEVERQARTRNGNHRTILLSAEAIELGGKPCIVSLVQDLTERKRAEESLRRLNRELRAISDCNQTLVRAEDEDKLLQDICQIVCEKAGYRMAWVGYANQDEGKTVRTVARTRTEAGYLATANITWGDTERGRGPTGTAIRTGETTCIDDFASDPRTVLWREAASQHGFRSSIALPLKDEGGHPFGALTIYSIEPKSFTPDEIRLLEELAGDLAFGITTLRLRVERRRATEQIEMLKVSIDKHFDGAYWLDTNNQFVYVNDTACQALGYAREELLGQPVTMIAPKATPPILEEVWKHLRETGFFNRESVHRRKDGSQFPVEVVATYVRFEGKEFNCGFARDITAHKRAEEELRKHRDHLEELVNERTAELQISRDKTEAAYQKLRELEKLRDDLVHMVAHDMRSPLAGLNMFFDLLSPEEVGAPDFQENLSMMRETSRALSGMVTSLLDVSRMEAGQMPLHCETVALARLTNDGLKHLSGLVQNRPITIRTPDSPVLAYCDPVLTQRIFENLLGNALKFTPAEGSIQIELVEEATWARFSITDTGPGIPVEYHAKVFEKFGQVELRRERKVPSSGLGLAFCKLAVETQHGNIRLESEPGRGSTFHVRLPRHAPGTSRGKAA